MNMNIQRLSSRYPKQKGRKLFFLKNMPWKQNSKQESGPLNSKSASQPIISVNINSELLCKDILSAMNFHDIMDLINQNFLFKYQMLSLNKTLIMELWTLIGAWCQETFLTFSSMTQKFKQFLKISYNSNNGRW